MYGKGIESSNSIFKQEIDTLHSAQLKLKEENRSFRDQLELKENNEISPPLLLMNDSSQIISAGDVVRVWHSKILLCRRDQQTILCIIRISCIFRIVCIFRLFSLFILFILFLLLIIFIIVSIFITFRIIIILHLLVIFIYVAILYKYLLYLPKWKSSSVSFEI